MEATKPKCSAEQDKDIDAKIYCVDCKIYMCDKCEQFHSRLFSSHQTIKLDNKSGDLFTGYCKEPNHSNKLEFFCKTHNVLCCVACTSKVSKKGYGLHKDCEICLIEDIKEEKKEKIKSNLKYLDEVSETLQDSIENLKKIFEKTIKYKDELNIKITHTFAKIRSTLNNREEEILREVNKLFDNMLSDKKIIDECDNIPEKIKSSMESREKIESDVNSSNLISFINECSNIENNMKEISKIDKIIKKYQKEGYKEIKFHSDENNIDTILGYIKILGKITVNNFDSSILYANIKKQEAIINWIKEKTNKNFIYFEKIFEMNINGSTSKSFHKYCDNQGPTLTLVKTTKNKIFGGFTPLDWDITGVDKIDENNQTFVFSINLMKKYDLIDKNKSAICCNKEYGPSFGVSDFFIESNMKSGETYANEITNFISNNNLELTDSEGNNEIFNVDNIEVFKVIY